MDPQIPLDAFRQPPARRNTSPWWRRISWLNVAVWVPSVLCLPALALLIWLGKTIH